MGNDNFVASGPAQLEPIAELLERVFQARPGSSLFARSYLRWKYYDDWPERRGSRSFILTEDDRIVAHVAIWPVRLRLASGIHDGISFGDWVAGEKHRGLGLSILKKLANFASFVLVTGGAPITRAILPRMGYASWGERTVYARVLRPLRQGLTRQDHQGWKEPLRVARNAAWSLSGTASRESWQAEDTQPSEALIASGGEAPGTVHTAGYLAYMLRCPSVRFRLLALRRGSEWKGYCMVGVAGGQARIADLRVHSHDQKDWDAAVAAAVGAVREDRAVLEVSTLGSVPKLDAALLANGFRARGRTPVVLLDRERIMLKEPLPQLGMLEDDAASLYEPGSGYHT